jgi:hypothetical protein
MSIKIEYGEKIKIGVKVKSSDELYVGNIIPLSSIESEKCETCGTELQGVDVHFFLLSERHSGVATHHEENNLVWCPKCEERR